MRNLIVRLLLKVFGLGGRSMVERVITTVLLEKKASGLNPLDILATQFKDKGLGGAFQSWVGTGKNEPISADQVTHGLGEDVMADLAKRAGLPADKLAPHVAKYLPGLIDKLTPGGKIQ